MRNLVDISVWMSSRQLKIALHSSPHSKEAFALTQCTIRFHQIIPRMSFRAILLLIQDPIQNHIAFSCEISSVSLIWNSSSAFVFRDLDSFEECRPVVNVECPSALICMLISSWLISD